MGRLQIVVLAAGLAMALSGCASSGLGDYGEAPPVRVSSAAPAERFAGALPEERGTNHVESVAGQKPLQCVPYAREHSQIKIFGDAYTWWDQASGKYERGANPASGTVMVLFNYAGAQRGHVAVVRRVVSAREIRVDHANWLDDGSIYVNDPVVDVSAANDWSQVRVWNIKTGGWGGKIFPVQGFIGQGSNKESNRGAPDDSDQDDALADGLMASADEPPAPPRPAAALAPRAPAARSPLVPVSARAAERNPPADSPYALTDADLAQP